MRVSKRLFPAALATLTFGAVASAQLDPAATYAVGQQPDGVAAADFNGDGLADLAVASDQTGAGDDLAILIGQPDGTFAAPFFVLLPNSSSPGDVVAGDLDGDGDMDLAVGLKDFNQVIAVLNNGAAAFTLGATASTGLQPRGMDIADADGDGDLDIVVANRDGNSITYLANSGAATFTATTMAAGAEPREAGFGDFDGDKDQDIAVSNHDDRTVTVYTNNGGAFAIMTTVSVGGDDRGSGLDTGDLNGDGLDDIATVSGDEDGVVFNRVVLFISTGASFTGPLYVPTGALDSNDVAIGDVDCDGDLDLVTANQLANSLSIMLNSGTATFGAATIMAAGAGADTIITANLGGDGDTDVVVGNRNGNSVSVYLSHCDDGGPAVCGNGVCEIGEDSTSCPADCGGGGPVCGNGVCEIGEDSTTCPADCGGGGGPGDFTFVGTNVAVGDRPGWSAAADFDRNGTMDLAVVADMNAAADNVAILFGNGDGTFAAPVYIILPASSSPQAVVAGDLDGDLDPDLAVSLRDNNQVIALINNGAGTFALGATAATGAEPRGMDIADADNDGDLDIVVANSVGNSVTYLRSNGNGTFVSMTMAAGLDPRDAAFGDFDGDTDSDFAVSNHDDRTIGIYMNTGGVFGLTTTLSVGPMDRPDGLATGDLDGDGLADIATASGDDADAFNRVITFMATGGGAFGGPAFFPTGPGALNTSDVVLADLDCDGTLDAAAANQTSANMSVLAGNGLGGLGAAVLFTTGTTPEHLTAADLDGDGAIDLVSSNRDSNNVTVFANDSCTGTGIPGDVNGDGVVSFNDLLQVLSNWGPCAGCAADLDGDMVVDFGDLLIVLSNWTG